jgi:hypothetical protein
MIDPVAKNLFASSLYPLPVNNQVEGTAQYFDHL